ncbi:MAG: Gfo/Idh/MocA family oxidoreductase, partial [Hyphomonadaceae bacterium]
MKKLKTGVIGAGVFGNYHAQKAAASARTDFTGMFDLDIERASRIAATYGATVHASLDDLLDQSDAVVVAVPATYHEQVARKALEHGCHVLVEKPLALNGEAARALAEKAHDEGLVLQVGHQERFVAKAMGIFGIEETPLILESVRAAPPCAEGRAGDVSVIWDLMIHDLDLAACMISREFDGVKAKGEIIHTSHIDQAEAEFHYKNGAVARLMSSRASEERIRTMRVVYPSGEINVDFLARTLRNTTPHDVKIDIAAELPDPLGM